MRSITLATNDDLPRLFDIWEASVQATHDFLHPDDFLVLVPVVERTLREFTPLHCVRDGAGQACAFMGVTSAWDSWWWDVPSRTVRQAVSDPAPGAYRAASIFPVSCGSSGVTLLGK